MQTLAYRFLAIAIVPVQALFLLGWLIAGALGFVALRVVLAVLSLTQRQRLSPAR